MSGSCAQIFVKMSKMDIKRVFEDIKDILFSKDEIIFAYLFGSSIKADNPNDIDIGIFVDEKKVSAKDAFDYALRLSVELSYKFGKEIDVVIMNYAPLGLLKNIIQGKVLLSKNVKIKDEFIEKIIREYMDYYYYSKELLKEVLSG